MCFNIFQNTEDQILFIIAGLALGHRFCEHRQVHEDQPHSDLIDGVGARLFVDQVPEHVFDEVLDRQDPFCLKMQISDLRIVT